MKIFARKRRQLRVGRMIDGLGAHDPLLDLGIVRVQIAHESRLRVGRTDDENFIDRVESARDVVKEAILVIRMILRRGVVIGMPPKMMAR